jgi:predicted nucleotidyltransferase
MGSHEIINLLRGAFDELAERYDVRSLAVFGSAARDELSATSDVDILVDFHGPATLRNYFALKCRLEDLLGRAVDLVTQQAVRAELRPHIERDLLHVA